MLPTSETRGLKKVHITEMVGLLKIIIEIASYSLMIVKTECVSKIRKIPACNEEYIITNRCFPKYFFSRTKWSFRKAAKKKQRNCE